MTNEIKEILDKYKNMEINELSPKQCNKILDYIANLQEENEELNKRIDKAIDYGNNCLENLKDQEDYLCESIDIVGLLRMIHKNYIDKLQGEDK